MPARSSTISQLAALCSGKVHGKTQIKVVAVDGVTVTLTCTLTKQGHLTIRQKKAILWKGNPQGMELQFLAYLVLHALHVQALKRQFVGLGLGRVRNPFSPAEECWLITPAPGYPRELICIEELQHPSPDVVLTFTGLQINTPSARRLALRVRMIPNGLTLALKELVHQRKLLHWGCGEGEVVLRYLEEQKIGATLKNGSLLVPLKHDCSLQIVPVTLTGVTFTYHPIIPTGLEIPVVRAALDCADTYVKLLGQYPKWRNRRAEATPAHGPAMGTNLNLI